MKPVCIAIVGNGFTISAKSEELIGLEFPGTEICRFQTLDELAGGHTGPVQLALIEQEAFAGRDLKLLENCPARQVALAYRDQEAALEAFGQVQSRDLVPRVGFLPMNLQIDCWASMLRLLFLGQSCVPQDFLTRRDGARDRAAPDRPRETGPKLTPREREILELAASGKQNKLIAVDLDLSEHTVKLHMHHIIKKLGVRNRTEAAGVFLGRMQGTA